MARLFLRFYLGVVLILFLAWSIQSYILGQQDQAENLKVVEEAYSGGARMARQQIEAASASEREAILAELQKQFDYPLQIVPLDAIPPYAQYRLKEGRDVVFYSQNEYFVITPLSNGKEGLRLGALPTFVEPSAASMMAGFGVILLLAAGAIALLLRPVSRQLRRVEQAALVIAGGDISARVDPRATTSVSALAQAFNAMATRIEGLLRSQRELLQAVSHEIRTPLARMGFAIDLIRDATLEEEREDRLCTLESSTQELDDLVGELLRYVRLGDNKPQADLTDTELLPAVEEQIEKCAFLHPSTQFEIGESLKKGSLAIRARRSNLDRVLSNLLSNAARFATSRVRVSASALGDIVQIEVEDDGEGIPVEEQARVFEPFVSLDDQDRGAGLGLAIVQRIVANSGGNVVATESGLGGCCIRIEWPGAPMARSELAR